jgi:hypothetical protein
VTQPQPSIPAPEPIDRSRALAIAIGQHVTQGWRVESQSAYDAILVKGQRPNHVLHLLLTVFTVGLWAIVWLIVALANSQHHMSIHVDEYGHAQVTRL